ncbi:hypothetical protein COLO4_02029 [Corchorus olitorius]|uniref:Uncharacterized protein n=1 Tax=Corchorus olitorius TaxID=93759 RepID=A0A1R3L1R8_9ROSI|nr:hypothetical protein COLO4_02029 [Corchorus olitorius]
MWIFLRRACVVAASFQAKRSLNGAFVRNVLPAPLSSGLVFRCGAACRRQSRQRPSGAVPGTLGRGLRSVRLVRQSAVRSRPAAAPAAALAGAVPWCLGPLPGGHEPRHRALAGQHQLQLP